MTGGEIAKIGPRAGGLHASPAAFARYIVDRCDGLVPAPGEAVLSGPADAYALYAAEGTGAVLHLAVTPGAESRWQHITVEKLASLLDWRRLDDFENRGVQRADSVLALDKTVNVAKELSILAARDPEFAAVLERAMIHACQVLVESITADAVTRVGSAGAQDVIPVEILEAPQHIEVWKSVRVGGDAQDPEVAERPCAPRARPRRPEESSAGTDHRCRRALEGPPPGLPVGDRYSTGPPQRAAHVPLGPRARPQARPAGGDAPRPPALVRLDPVAARRPHRKDLMPHGSLRHPLSPRSSTATSSDLSSSQQRNVMDDVFRNVPTAADERPTPKDAQSATGSWNDRQTPLLEGKEDDLVRTHRTRSSDVEPGGLEPPTPCLQSRCATNCAMAPGDAAGAGQRREVLTRRCR